MPPVNWWHFFLEKIMDIELFKFAFFPDFENRIKELAENLADKENWDFSTGGRKNSILKK